MAVKTNFTHHDFTKILARYDIGTLIQFAGIEQGTVQTNYVLHMSKGKYIFRYYENRPLESVLFERDLLAFLKKHNYPGPTPLRDIQGSYVNRYLDKPYVIFAFVEGRFIGHPQAYHWQQLIHKAAELHNITRSFSSRYTLYRWNYCTDLCLQLATGKARQMNTACARQKLAWLSSELETLELPPSVPKGICHCDFHFANVLFEGDKFIALLDFDDANHTFLLFDLVGLIEYWAWPHSNHLLDFKKARYVLQEYMKHRPLLSVEQLHLYDVYKLSILFDCVWYFERGPYDNFLEKRKIETLNRFGRQQFVDGLFKFERFI